MWVIRAVWKPPSQRECTYLDRELWFPGRCSVCGRGWKQEKEKDGKWSGREWLINAGNKHILTCPQLIPGKAKGNRDGGLKESQTILFPSQPIPLRSSYLGFWLEEEGHSFFFFFLSYSCCFCPSHNTDSQPHWVSYGEFSGTRLLLSCGYQLLDEVGWVGSTLWSPIWLLFMLHHQQQSLALASLPGWMLRVKWECLQGVGNAFVRAHEDHATLAVWRAPNLLWTITKTKSLELLFSPALSLSIYPTVFCWLLSQRIFLYS